MNSSITLTKNDIGIYNLNGIKFKYSLHSGNIISSPTLLKDYKLTSEI